MKFLCLVYLYLINYDGTIFNGHDSFLVERIEDPFVFGPRDKGDWRIGLNVTTDDALQTAWNVLDVRMKRNPSGNCKIEFKIRTEDCTLNF